MTRKAGPPWVEINSALAHSLDFICLKDEVKASYLLWALRYPSGDLPATYTELGRVIGKPGLKAKAIVDFLRLGGLVDVSPNGKMSLTAGWVREHKTSAKRVAKFREKLSAQCNVTKASETPPGTPNVTLHVTLQSDAEKRFNGVSETLQKEVSPTPPLRKTTPNPEVGFGVSARERATPTKTDPLQRVLWSEIGSVPDGWLRSAAQQREQYGLEPVDMALVAADFLDTYGPQLVNPKTRAEWQGQFNKFARRQFAGKPNGHAPSQVDQCRAVIAREQAGFGRTFYEN